MIWSIPAVGIASTISLFKKVYNENSGKLARQIPNKAIPLNISKITCRSDDLTGLDLSDSTKDCICSSLKPTVNFCPKPALM